MGDFQTEAEYARNVNTKFVVQLDPKPIELTLVAVTSRPSEAHEEQGMERFSALFTGPLDAFLPQQTYRLTHEDMGEFEVFLVAVAQDADKFRYEAVYNYYTPKAVD